MIENDFYCSRYIRNLVEISLIFCTIFNNPEKMFLKWALFSRYPDLFRSIIKRRNFAIFSETSTPTNYDPLDLFILRKRLVASIFCMKVYRYRVPCYILSPSNSLPLPSLLFNLFIKSDMSSLKEVSSSKIPSILSFYFLLYI